MAVQNGSAAVKPGMSDQTSFNGRSGGQAKRTQTDFPLSNGMKDMTQFSRVGPGMAAGGTPDPTYHFGPDASSANPTEAEDIGKGAQTTFEAKWGQTDGMGNGLDQNIGGRVLSEAILGSATLPSSTSENSGGGPAGP